jgi:hypothetical protein
MKSENRIEQKNSDIPEWKQYMLDHWVLTPEERILLQDGPKSLAQAWHLQALKYRYESRKPSKHVED